MGNITDTLIKRAATVINPQRIGDRLVGDVGCALVTDKGNVYVGVCLDTASGTGFCAEASAIAAMVTAGEFRIKQIVAVWKDERGGIFVLSPCGRCREFIKQMHKENLETDIVLGKGSIVKLHELLPHPDQFVPVEWEEV
jgi:cytidine deaminase